jgi:transcriptional regulator with XRE-family HTH domain
MMNELLEAKRLAARLRRIRLERGLSLRGAAAKIGVTKETLSDLERARRQPHPPTLAKIAEGYGVEISDLLGPMVEEEPVPLAETPPPPGPASLEEGRLEGSSQKYPQQWERVLASVHERQSEVAAKVDELVETSAHSGEVDLHQVKRALDEAQGFQFTLMRAMSGVSLRHSRGRVEMAFNPFAPEFDPAQWDEVGNAMGFYADIVDRLVKAGLAERLVESGLAEWKERAGQKRELVPAGFGE